MNDPIFWRLVWKEYRTQRWFWVGVVGLALVAQLIVLLACDRPEERTAGVFYVAWWLPVFYALGCGAVLFAAEKEDETFELLRILPTTADRLLASKLSFCLVSLGAMIGLLQVLAWGFAWGDAPTSNAERLAGFAALAVEFLAWSVLFSLLTQRVLNAIALATLAALAANLNSGMLFRCAAFAVVASADAWLVRRWLSDRPLGWSLPFAFPTRRRSLAALASVEERAPAWRRAFKRLLWQEARHAFPIAATFCVVGGVLVLFSPWLYRTVGVDVAYFIVPLTPLFFGICVFRGEQHGRRFRFLAERGLDATATWLSKQMVWILILTTSMLLLQQVDHSGRELWYGLVKDGGTTQRNPGGGYSWIEPDVARGLTPISDDFYISPAKFWFFFTSLTYGVGQLASLLFARGVMASFVGLVVGGISAAWLLLMWELQVPLLWSVGLIPLIFLLTTLVRSRTWMLERNAWCTWLRVATTLCLPLCAVLVAVVAYRAYEIPAAWPYENDAARKAVAGWPKDLASEKPTIDALQTGDMYRSAAQLVWRPKIGEFPAEPGKSAMGGWDQASMVQRALLERNQEALQVLLEATKRDACAFLDPSRAEPDSEYFLDIRGIWALDDLLLLSARKLEAEDRLDEAFDRYLAALRMARHGANGAITSWGWTRSCFMAARVCDWLPGWAAHPKQTPERIASAIRRLEEEADKFPKPSDALATERTRAREAVTRSAESSSARWEDFVYPILVCYCPWERTRGVRLLDAITCDQLYQLRSVEEYVEKPENDLVSLYEHHLAMEMGQRKGPRSYRWLGTTPALRYIGFFGDRRLTNTLREMGYREVGLRANLTIMALVAWRLKHGQLPNRLDELVGTFLERPLLDPWSGMEFGYYPNGLPDAQTSGPIRIGPGEPFLWSAGEWGARIVPASSPSGGRARYIVTLRHGAEVVIRQTGPRWEYRTGRVFPIPK